VTGSLRARRLTELLAHQTGLSYVHQTLLVCAIWSLYRIPALRSCSPYIYFSSTYFSLSPTHTHTQPIHFFFFLMSFPLNADGGGGPKDSRLSHSCVYYYRQFRLACDGNGGMQISFHTCPLLIFFFLLLLFNYRKFIDGNRRSQHSFRIYDIFAVYEKMFVLLSSTLFRLKTFF
jgi:hypothetical protein